MTVKKILGGFLPPTIDTASSAEIGEQTPEPALEFGTLSEGFFTEADADGDGMVTKAEFIHWTHIEKGRAPTDADMKKFYDADANGDGRISRAEFDRYVRRQKGKKLALSAAALEVAEAGGADEVVPEPSLELGTLSEGFFTEADADGDGMVTKAEFMQWHAANHDGRPPAHADMMKFYEADENDDGSISLAEFQKYVSRKKKKSAPKLALSTTSFVADDLGHTDGPVPEPSLELGTLSEGFFTEADADGDGLVTKAEFMQWHSAKNGRPPTDSDMKRFYAADANGDGSISLAEFEAYTALARQPTQDLGEDFVHLPTGAAVVVSGLVRAAKHNGKHGKVKAYSSERGESYGTVVLLCLHWNSV
eukprot:SAG22_NODE_14_length_33165_cov_13.196698_26_plen_364_part_00